jgi:diguanylate cyclase (GGDEF)-like protein
LHLQIEFTSLYKQQEEKILHQAHFDALTQLPNRFLVLDRLLQSIKEAHRYEKKVAILFLDLDDFKKVNDSLGHEVGDKLLIEAAHRLLNVVRSQDTVGRHGGDEFIIILGDMDDENEAIPIADNILNSFREAFVFDRRKFVLTSSIGISIYPNDGLEPAELLRKADTAMYKSKEEGKNMFSFITEEMNKGVARRIILEEQLRGALERNEFSVHFQPLIDLTSQQIVSAEALLRWDNNILGKVGPDEFIPITEQLGLIILIGRYVLSTSLKFAKQQRDNHVHDFSISVNVSPVQFRDPEFASFIQCSLADLKLPGSALSLEITEGVLLSGHSHVTETIASLYNLGIRISMDDFGTGYSSFNYLRNYPFSTLKIDRSFIMNIDINPSDYKIVGSIISMAKGLGLRVVAEGVETANQLECLVRLKCDLIQGYYYSPPLTESNFSSFISSWLNNHIQAG